MTGFETSSFYEGERASWALITSNRPTDTELAGVSGFGSFPMPFDIEFVGRRSLCDMGNYGHVIVVEHVVTLAEAH